jgi:MFS family permease
VRERGTEERLWRDRRFASYWVGQGVSEFGDRITEIALPLIAVVTLAGSPSEVGLLTAAVWAPNLISLFIGTWVDHQRHRRRLLIAADLTRALVLLSLPVAHLLGIVTLAQLFVVALLAGFGQVLYQTAYPSFFVSLVRRDQFLEANSLLSTTRSISYIAGPAVAGVLIEVLTAPVAIVVDACSFVVSAVLIRRVEVTEVEVDHADETSLLHRSREGMTFVLRHPYLRASLGCATTINFFNLMGSALVLLFASRELGLSAGVIGLVFGVGASGGLVGAVVARHVSRLIGVGWTIAVGSVLFSAPMAALPLAGGSTWSKVVVLASVEFVSGVGVMCFDINLNSLMTAVTPDAMRSRVIGAFTSINYGIRPVGAILGGILGDLLGVRPTLVVAGLGGMIACCWLFGSPIISTATIDELDAGDG